MIIQTGMRTDIPAFYSEWFLNRLNAGYVLVRNPYNENQVTRYSLLPDVVDLIAFCTKNPAPMLPHMDALKPYGQYWFVTITAYGTDIEPHVPCKEAVMEDFKRLSECVGVDSIGWRYDPIFLSDTYTVERHIQEFTRMAAVLAVIFSFCPKFAALVSAMPTGTIGGVSLILYGMISAIGVRNLVENRVDLAKSRNVIVVSLIISLALGITFSAAGAITFHVGEFTLNFSGLAVAAIVGIVVNAILPGKDYNFQNDYEYGKTTEDHGQML